MKLPKTFKGNKYAIVIQSKLSLVYPAPDQIVIRIAWLLVDEIFPIRKLPEALS